MGCNKWIRAINRHDAKYLALLLLLIVSSAAPAVSSPHLQT
jgi:hypothetical protein